MALIAAVIDANVFYSMTKTDLVVQAARDGIFRAVWTDTIHAEWITALNRNNPALTLPALERRRSAMDRAVPDALVTGYEPLIATLALPDPHDRHVLAAAIQAGCAVIVTSNLKHFPAAVLAPLGIRALAPDEFLCDLLARDPDGMLASVKAVRGRLKNPPFTVDEYLAKISRSGLPRFAAALISHADVI